MQEIVSALAHSIATNKDSMHLFIICSVLGIGAFMHCCYELSDSFIRGRNERQMAKLRHDQDIERLRETRRIAELNNDAIKLLVADDDLGQDFERRLRIALKESKKRVAAQTVPTFSEDASDDEEQAKAQAKQG